ncbi:MAG: HDOD domain-containing protein [Longimicrobiales bacterium]
MNPRAEALAGKAAHVASPPLVYDRLNQVLAHPHCGSADIARVIGEDPGLTSRLLRLVNSGFFGFPQPVESVAKAVTVVGTAQIRDLALATSVVSAFDRIPPEIVDLQAFWLHSLACGVTARVLAARRGVDNVERYFVAGLLHEIGHLVIVAGAREQAVRVAECARDGRTPWLDCERAILETDHTEVGGALMRAWNLPESLQEAVTWHHEPEQAGAYTAEAAAVHVAEVTAHAMAWGRCGDGRVPPFRGEAWDCLGLEVDELEGIVEEVEGQLESALHLMGAA